MLSLATVIATTETNANLVDDLSFKKNATQSTVQVSKDKDLYKADNALDKDITTCMRTEPIGTNSPDKTVWWKVDLGGVHNIHSVNILFKNYDGYERRQQGRFAGFSIYTGNTDNLENSSLCYKDGPTLPPLNFTTTCFISGRYIIFYNERLDGVTYPAGYETSSTVYTELCEVQVYGCLRPDVYGSDCNESCPANCIYNTCHIQNGTCFSCKPGWTGRTCNTGCSDGLYGPDCKQHCSEHCRDNSVCDHVTGLCGMGCAAGWSGSLCNKDKFSKPLKDLFNFMFPNNKSKKVTT
uniref:Multiple epidermal growth factor-like domains protein 6 isoform X2 n=1 Tax=Crassostrea virginica TaxID=6565 RepID=A0A8B8C9P0_CRAVI|nr:multiple epidermal growth factor-like domains protein 6 isoform X2 [Crassostrea virginica]